MCLNKDSDKKETVSANHLSGSQLSAQAQYRVNYGYLASDSMLEEDNFKVVDGATTSTQPRTDETINLDVDPLLLLSPPTQTTWDKRDLSTKSLSNPPPKKLLQDYSSPTTLFNLFFDVEVVEYLVKITKLYAHQEKGKHLFNIDQSEMCLFITILLLSGYNVLSRQKFYMGKIAVT